MDILLQAATLLLLAGVMGGGYRQWLQPRDTILDRWQRGLLLLILLTWAGGLVGAFFWWMDEPRSFAWDLPPFASRMLAAASWSFAVACFLTLRYPTRARLRLILLMLFTYLVPLTVAILLFHLARFDPRAPISYGFFAIVGTMVAATLFYLLRPVTILPPPLAADGPPPAPVRFYLMLVALLTSVWGVALFVSDQGPISAVWVWPGDLLSSRLIAVMLATLAVSSVYGLRSDSAARVSLATILTYGLGVTLASLWSLLGGKPLQLSYFSLFGLLFLSSISLLFTLYRTARPVPSPQG